jgi:hypothetical protein
MGLVDQLSSPAFATSVGLLRWNEMGSMSPSLGVRVNQSKAGGRLREWFRNFLPG